MIRSGHDDLMKSLSSSEGAVGLLNRPAKFILIAGAPDIGEGNLFLRHRRTIDDLVAVVSEKKVHVIEVAEAAVDERGFVSPAAKDRTECEEILIVRPLHDGLPGRGRD